MSEKAKKGFKMPSSYTVLLIIIAIMAVDVYKRQTPESTEISGYGLHLLGQLCYVINEWHRVNVN